MYFWSAGFRCRINPRLPKLRALRYERVFYSVSMSDLDLMHHISESVRVMYLAVVVGPVVGTATLRGGTNGGAGTDSSTGKDGGVHGVV